VFAADRLWKVAPAAAERLLYAGSGYHSAASLQLLINTAPVEKTGSSARAVLAGLGKLSESDRLDWARERLPAAGAHAETLARILHTDIGASP
jgi:hypothetical protein